MLCALSSTQREQTLCALDLKNKRESGTCLSFVITERLKTSKPGKSTEVTFECLSDQPQICTKCTVMEYILRTAAYDIDVLIQIFVFRDRLYPMSGLISLSLLTL